MDPKLIAAAVLALLAGAMWVGFARAAPRQTALGTITAKVHKPEGTYQQVPSGLDRGFRVPTNIPIAESFLFNITVDGLDEPVATALNTIRSRQFEEGQRVKVTFERRGFGPFLRRIRVVDLSPN
jgi:hypothetical protein